MNITIEELEPRLTPTRVIVEDGVLTIIGTNKPDMITVRDGAVEVETIVRAVGKSIAVSKHNVFDIPEITAMVIKGRGGRDYIVNNTNTPASIFGGKGGDYLQGGLSVDHLNGEDGNDIVVGNFGDDILSGGNGNDNLAGNENNDALFGGKGKDTLRDIEGANVFDGDAGVDTIIASEDNQYLQDVDDLFFLIQRRDSFTLENGILYLQGEDSLQNTVTIDRATDGILDIVINGQLLTITQDVSRIVYLGGNERDTFRNNTEIPCIAFGMGGSDILSGGTGNDILAGNEGDDFIGGHNGNDEADGGIGADRVNGLSGCNILKVDDADLSFPVFLPNDTIVGVLIPVQVWY